MMILFVSSSSFLLHIITIQIKDSVICIFSLWYWHVLKTLKEKMFKEKHSKKRPKTKCRRKKYRKNKKRSSEQKNMSKSNQ